jgi:predicted metalloprotease with PDZ domain
MLSVSLGQYRTGFHHRWTSGYIVISILCLVAALPCAAQCTFSQKSTGRVLTYVFEPTVAAENNTLHVTLSFQGDSEGTEEIEIPTRWADETLHGMANLRALSRDTVLADSVEDRKTLRYPPNQQVVLSYDLVKDWTGPFKHPLQFHAVIMREYIEINGENAFVYPKMDRGGPITINFDWQKVPATWALATSFGTSSGPDDRCQSYSGPLDNMREALFAAGVFRIHHFQIGNRPAVLAIRGQWIFTDEQAIADIQKAVSIVRDFWHDENFPYFLITVKAYDQDHGSSDGSAFTNAFWMYMSRLDPLSVQLPTLVHETFHAWNPRRMGLIPQNGEKSIEWFREGFTKYYEYLLLYRTDLMPLPDYLENVNGDLRDYPASSSAYVRGRVIAAWLDWQIRKNSNNKNSLDNVMVEMVREADMPLTNDRILQTAGRYVTAAARTELQQAIEQNAFPQMNGATFGRCVQISEIDIPTFDLGFDFAASREAHKVISVIPDSAAFKAGLRDDQTLTSWSFYNNQPDRIAKLYIQTDAGKETIQYYPRGKAVATPQFHLDEKAYAANESSCRMQ